MESYLYLLKAVNSPKCQSTYILIYGSKSIRKTLFVKYNFKTVKYVSKNFHKKSSKLNFLVCHGLEKPMKFFNDLPNLLYRLRSVFVLKSDNLQYNTLGCWLLGAGCWVMGAGC